MKTEPWVKRSRLFASLFAIWVAGSGHAVANGYVQKTITIPAGMYITPIAQAFTGNAAIASSSTTVTANEPISAGQSIVTLLAGACGAAPSPGAVWDATASSFLGVATCSSGTLTFPGNTLAAGAGGSSDSLKIGAVIPVSFIPASCQIGAMVTSIDHVGGYGAQFKAPLGTISQCGAGGLNVLSVFNVVSNNQPYPSGADTNSAPNLLLSGPIASSDNCRFIYSEWWRGSGSPSSSHDYESSFIADMVSGASAGPTTNPSGGSEQSRGIDLDFDNAITNSLRINFADSNVLANSSKNHNVEIALHPPSNWINYGAWNHFLWSGNTCQTNKQYTQMSINGVPLNFSGQPSTNLFNQAGINFSNPAGGFQLGSGMGNNAGQVSFGDVYLWVGADIVCGKSTTACNTGAQGQTLLWSDIDNFGQRANVQTSTLASAVNAGGSVSVSDCPLNSVSGQEALDTTNNIFLGIANGCSSGMVTMLSGNGAVNADSHSGATVTFFNWVPVSPSVAVSAYGAPLVGCSATVGPAGVGAANYVANCNGNGSPNTPLQAVNFYEYTSTGATGDDFALTDLTASPNYVAPNNHSGQPPHVPGYKWACIGSTGSVTTPSFATCANDIAVNDLLILVFAGHWSSASNAANCANWAPFGFTSWTNISNTARDGLDLCIAYKIATSADVAASSYTGSAFAVATGSSITGLVDYGNFNTSLTPDGWLATAPFYADSTALTSPGIRGAQGTNDIVVGIFEAGSNASVPMSCPPALPSRRVDFAPLGSTYPPEILICDSGTGITPPTGGTSATQTAIPQYGTGALLAIGAS